MTPIDRLSAHFSSAGAFTGCCRWLGGVALTILLSCPPSHAVDLQQPAHIHVVVRDAAGQPIPGAVVNLQLRTWWGSDKDLAQGTVDGSGLANFSIPDPGGIKPQSLVWHALLTVQKSGYALSRDYLDLFPGAHIEKAVTLMRVDAAPPRTTIIRLCGPRDEPLPFVSLYLSYVEQKPAEDGSTLSPYTPLVSDERGEVHFSHRPLRGSFSVQVSDSQRLFKDAAVVTFRMSKEDLKTVEPRRKLRLKVLTPDGAPAAGWFVSSQVVFRSSMGPVDGMVRLEDTVYWFDVNGLQKLGRDGVVTLPFAGRDLVIVSPEGIPLMFSLNPAGWPPGERRITLQLPPVRRVQEGQLSREGQPAAGEIINVEDVAANGIYTKVIFSPVHPGASTLTGGVPTGEPMFHKFVTAADGSYKLPIYFGYRPRYRLDESGWYMTGDLLTSPQTKLMQLPGEAPANDKEVTLRFVDEQGKDIAELSPGEFVAYKEQTALVYGGGSGNRDAAGFHLFLDPAADRLVIHPAAPGWRDTSQTFDIPGPHDRLITVTVPSTQRLRPLTGIVLDPEGKPVPDVDVHLVREPSGEPRDYNAFRTKTDERGRFAFDGAPDECTLNLSRSASPDGEGGLPGWTETPAVTAVRTLTIHLHPYGQVCILLPSMCGPGRVVATLLDADHPSRNIWRDGDFGAGSIHVDAVPPGRYRLDLLDWRRQTPVLGTAGSVVVNVTAKHETTVDLRNCKALNLDGQTPPWQPLTVYEGQTPASGVSVTFYTTSPAHGDILPSWLRQPSWNYSAMYGPIVKSNTDLTDDAGQVWYPAEPGRQYIAVARQPGRRIGWATFTVTAGQPIGIELQRTRTLQVNLHELNGPTRDASYVGPPVQIRLGVGEMAARALLNALNLLAEVRWSPSFSVEPTASEIQRDGPFTHFVEDLPVGRDYDIQLPPTRSAPAVNQMVHLDEAGPAVQDVQLDYPAR